MSERPNGIIFPQGGVEVTSALVRVGQTTYAISSIGSVFIESPKRGGALLVAIVLAVIAIATIGDNPAVGIGLFVACVIVVLFAINQPSKLMLRTASGDHPVFQNKKAFLQQIKSAIEEAIIRRS